MLLLRAYASELSLEEENEADLHSAVRRMLDHYLRTTHGALQRLDPAHAGAGLRRDRDRGLADLVLLLAGDRTATVTGAGFVVDGGLITTL
ncbi:hypothetical protein [Streptomyces sp. NPDC051576]|uniref:hypothetical protein n=1 Tax=Streptomyces sp. NPDC051576 TaxID=3155803 RepID=UPI003430E35B